MSGFVGLYPFDRAAQCDHALLERMTMALHRRGKHTGSWSNGHIGLAMAVWQASPQEHESVPYRTPDTILAADARLDYRQDLIARLRTDGALAPREDMPLSDHAFIAKAYACYGEACTRYLDGDYAFLLWDTRKQRLFGARSMTGLRPFLYSSSRQGLCCASEAKLLLLDSQISTAFDSQWMATWLLSAQECARLTPYSAIQKLPPGYSLIADEDGVRIQAFWMPTTHPECHQHAGQQEYTKEFRTLLFSSVRSRLSSEHPFLLDVSGGLDSSSIACIAGSLRQQNEPISPLYGVHAYSAHSPENDDRALASLVAETSGIPLSYLCYDDLRPFAGIFQPQPWCDAPTPPTLFFANLYERIFQICQERGIRGHLRGDFGDQLFDASPHYLRTLAREHHYSRLIQEIWLWQRSGTVALVDVLNQVLGQRHQGTPEGLLREKAPWLRSRVFVDDALQSQQERAILRLVADDPLARILFLNMQRHDVYVSMQNDGIVASGIETLEPYMDRRLIEFLLSCPAQYQMRFGGRKHLLREAMRDVLPEPVRIRRSKGRIARLLMAGIAEHHRALLALVESMPAELEPYIDATRLAQALSYVACGGSLDQVTFFSALSLVLWAHRLPWCRGQRLPGDLS